MACLTFPGNSNAGTAFPFEKTGDGFLLITNWHVTGSDSIPIHVKLGRKKFIATLEASDPDLDLAVLQVNGIDELDIDGRRIFNEANFTTEDDEAFKLYSRGIECFPIPTAVEDVSLRRGLGLVLFGFSPESDEIKVSNGIVTGIKSGKPNQITTNAVMNAAYSGGPVLDLRTQTLIGVSVESVMDHDQFEADFITTTVVRTFLALHRGQQTNKAKRIGRKAR